MIDTPRAAWRIHPDQPHAHVRHAVDEVGLEAREVLGPALGILEGAGADEHARSRRPLPHDVIPPDASPARAQRVAHMHDIADAPVEVERLLVDGYPTDHVVQRRISMRAHVHRHPLGAQCHGRAVTLVKQHLSRERRVAGKDRKARRDPY
jgi:hypothetical protein